MNSIYISGPMTRFADLNRPAFESARQKLLSTGVYSHVVTPFDVTVLDKNNSWVEYMKEDIKELMNHDEIYMLKNYKLSKGAMIELELAKKLYYKISYEY